MTPTKKESKYLSQFISLAPAIAAVFVPIVIVFIGNLYTNAIKEREVKLQYIDLAIDILVQKPQEKNIEIRKWAINLINHYSAVPLGQGAILELLEYELEIAERKYEASKEAFRKARQELERELERSRHAIEDSARDIAIEDILKSLKEKK